MSAVLIRRLSLRSLLLSSVVVIAGCASMSPEECRTADWHEQGMRDGQRGMARAYLEEHVKACREVGITPNAQQYMAGRDIGIRYYCTPENGLLEGRQGRHYANSCPIELEAAFLNRYHDGRRVYQAQQRADSVERRVQSKQRELDKSRDDKERSRLRRELRDLDRDLRRARDDLYRLERYVRY